MLSSAYKNKNKRYTLQQEVKEKHENRFPDFALLSMKTAPKKEVKGKGNVTPKQAYVALRGPGG
jgi:hypothetical protein